MDHNFTPGSMQSVGVIGKLERRLARLLVKRPGTVELGAPLVSFTFDDVPQSACVLGRSLLEAQGAKGTYYVCGGYTGLVREEAMHTASDLQALHAAGHEIGCHGWGHRDYQALGPRLAAQDMDRNIEYLGSLGIPNQDTLNFAYPFGCVSPSVKGLIEGRYASARGVVGGLHGEHVDRNLLGAVALYDHSLSADAVTELIERNARDRGWLVFFTHGVSEAPGAYDCSPRLLEHALHVAGATGSQVCTVQAALGLRPARIKPLELSPARAA